ncbi:MAG: hypothetical protein QOI03_2163 [Solirubrobacteraceae bacterium]|jgi:hypothetical protein|nr:hypothetical protein [Solirubrobacteraceae bacterium]
MPARTVVTERPERCTGRVARGPAPTARLERAVRSGAGRRSGVAQTTQLETASLAPAATRLRGGCETPAGGVG